MSYGKFVLSTVKSFSWKKGVTFFSPYLWKTWSSCNICWDLPSIGGQGLCSALINPSLHSKMLMCEIGKREVKEICSLVFRYWNNKWYYFDIEPYSTWSLDFNDKCEANQEWVLAEGHVTRSQFILFIHIIYFNLFPFLLSVSLFPKQN